MWNHIMKRAKAFKVVEPIWIVKNQCISTTVHSVIYCRHDMDVLLFLVSELDIIFLLTNPRYIHPVGKCFPSASLYTTNLQCLKYIYNIKGSIVASAWMPSNSMWHNAIYLHCINQSINQMSDRATERPINQTDLCCTSWQPTFISTCQMTKYSYSVPRVIIALYFIGNECHNHIIVNALWKPVQMAFWFEYKFRYFWRCDAHVTFPIMINEFSCALCKIYSSWNNKNVCEFQVFRRAICDSYESHADYIQ